MMDDDSFLSRSAGIGEELKAALVFLTRLPPSWIGATPAVAVRPDFTVAARVFPLAGVLVGIAGGIVLFVAAVLAIPPLIGGALAVAATMLLAGALHEDGLADFADSFGGATRATRLAILDDSRIGTYGAAALALSVLIRAAALGALLAHGPLLASLALIAGEAASRAALVRMWYDLPAARPMGLAADTGPPQYNAMLLALAIAVAIVIVTVLPALGWRPTAIAAILCVLAAYGTIRLAAATLGGRTGDTLGACQQVALAAFLVGASAL